MRLRDNNLSVKKSITRHFTYQPVQFLPSIFQRFSDAYAKYAGDALYSYIYHLDHVRIKVGSKVAWVSYRE